MSYAGTTYRPKDGIPRWENFPYLEIAEQNGSWESLGASPGWQDDPYGVPEEPKYVTFTAEGPGAALAVEEIRGVLSKPPPVSKLGIAGSSAKGMLKYLFESPTEGQRYRPPDYRPPSRPEKLPEPTRPKPQPAELPKPQGGSKPELPTANSMFRDALRERGVLRDWDHMQAERSQRRAPRKQSLEEDFWKH